MSGLWYVQIAGTGFPELAVRGQIVPVPEPSGVALIAFGLAVFAFANFSRTMLRAKSLVPKAAFL